MSAEQAEPTGQTAAPRLPIALDAMGGDVGLPPNVAGAVAAARAGVRVVLVGDRVKLHAELSQYPDINQLPLNIVDAPDVIGMDEHASDVRGRHEASINVATRLVKNGLAGAVVSMGHSGATMAASLFILGRLPGIERPAILTQLPSKAGMVALLDTGANTDVKAVYLLQWARLASLYLKVAEHRPSPTVGLLSIGEEDHKGNAVTLEAHALLRQHAQEQGINFVGNVEGRDIFLGSTDIVVTDGFTGNIALKLAEGEAKMLFGWIKEALNSTLQSKLGGLLVRASLQELAATMNPSTYGATILLGVKGLSYIGHGSADAEAVTSALLRAERDYHSGLIAKLMAALSA